jgi:hypothetical protein
LTPDQCNVLPLLPVGPTCWPDVARLQANVEPGVRCKGAIIAALHAMPGKLHCTALHCMPSREKGRNLGICGFSTLILLSGLIALFFTLLPGTGRDGGYALPPARAVLLCSATVHCYGAVLRYSAIVQSYSAVRHYSATVQCYGTVQRSGCFTARQALPCSTVMHCSALHCTALQHRDETGGFQFAPTGET